MTVHILTSNLFVLRGEEIEQEHVDLWCQNHIHHCLEIKQEFSGLK